jgi:hypothetical protein
VHEVVHEAPVLLVVYFGVLTTVQHKTAGLVELGVLHVHEHFFVLSVWFFLFDLHCHYDARLTNVGSVSDEKWTCSIESTRQKALRLEKERKEQQQALEEVERQKVGLYSLSCYFILVVRFKIEKSMEA